MQRRRDEAISKFKPCVNQLLSCAAVGSRAIDTRVRARRTSPKKHRDFAAARGFGRKRCVGFIDDRVLVRAESISLMVMRRRSQIRELSVGVRRVQQPRALCLSTHSRIAPPHYSPEAGLIVGQVSIWVTLYATPTRRRSHLQIQAMRKSIAVMRRGEITRDRCHGGACA
jgi:hypothetical protein